MLVYQRVISMNIPCFLPLKHHDLVGKGWWPSDLRHALPSPREPKEPSGRQGVLEGVGMVFWCEMMDIIEILSVQIRILTHKIPAKYVWTGEKWGKWGVDLISLGNLRKDFTNNKGNSCRRSWGSPSGNQSHGWKIPQHYFADFLNLIHPL